ncbi:MAG: hypothetical protein KGQ75_05085 [Sphingomonadales bacterium]|uniref:hypothetical protein n=1 Tax=unclassified Novosphingobium TaxID=2644732 RepID=UPI000A5FA0A7|nr:MULTISPECIES: hypothetical protein [unclassified Novosphingobium]MBU6393928.1 hypothetical protein [Sphingomonadales bacterium]
MTPDKVVAVIGIVMALVLVLANGRLRGLKLSSGMMMAGAWVVIILAVAVAFAGFRR